MRVLHINCNFAGKSDLHRTMIFHLSPLPLQNSVFVPVCDKVDSKQIQLQTEIYISNCFRSRDRYLFDYKQKKIIQSLQRNIAVSEFDLIHAYTLFTDGNCARRLSEKYGIPYVVAVRNTDVNAFFRLMPHLRGRGVRIMRDAKAVFFLSEAYRDQVLDKYVPRKYRKELMDKIKIIPNGIDDYWLENLNLQRTTPSFTSERKPIRMIFAGRIDKNKNIPTVQRAMQLLRARGYEAQLTVVAGHIEDQRELTRIKQDPFTTHIPGLPKEKLIEQYRSHDIFVMPSFTESFGLVYAEAISQGLPVVYTKGQGFDGQFDEGEVGYHADAHSPESVAEAILRIVERYEALTAGLPQKAARFQWKRIVARYGEIYDEIQRGESCVE